MEETQPKISRRPEEPAPPEWALKGAELLKSRPGHRRVALTGGVGSGKSTVAELMAAFGAELIDFDLLSREVLSPESVGWSQAVELFGPKIKGPDLSLDRKRIAQIVFKKPLIRKALEDIVHPLAWELMIQRLTELEESPLVVVDVPLLFEARLNGLFSPVVVCYASFEAQYRRLRARDPQKSRFLAKRIIKSQMPFAEKVRLADAIVDNNGSLSLLIRQTKELWLRLSAPDNGAP
ncbi:MAG: dephospho-CoA kinase [Deltaproteobacteria bacterium]|jgi:dephospho-CoA kinase|nr:dephospho-CoA kinase [Deltaproteobacteria bacterium]